MCVRHVPLIRHQRKSPLTLDHQSRLNKRCRNILRYFGLSGALRMTKKRSVHIQRVALSTPIHPSIRFDVVSYVVLNPSQLECCIRDSQPSGYCRIVPTV